MKHPAHAVPLREPAVREGGNAVVVSVEGPSAVVRIGEGLCPAGVAFSCLVAPKPGDRALCATDEAGETFIIAILERPGEQDLTISFPAGASMVAPNGDLGIFTRRSVTLAANEGFNCLSDRVVHKSREAVVDYGEVTANGNVLRANFSTVTIVARTIATMAQQAIERFRTYMRRSEDSDRVSAGSIDRKADGLYSLNSGHTMMLSRHETKIDGDRIFMG